MSEQKGKFVKRVGVTLVFLMALLQAADAFLAYQAGAESVVVYKHIATIVYLLITFSVLKLIMRNEQDA